MHTRMIERVQKDAYAKEIAKCAGVQEEQWRDAWRWWLVVNKDGDVDQAFNSWMGASDYIENTPGSHDHLILQVAEYKHADER